MNKKIAITLGIVGTAVVSWYFLIPPRIKVTQIDQVNKKVRFTYDGKEQVFDYSNPSLAMVLPVVRMFNTSVTASTGTNPLIHFITRRGTSVVAQQQIILNKSVMS